MTQSKRQVGFLMPDRLEGMVENEVENGNFATKSEFYREAARRQLRGELDDFMSDGEE